MEYAKIKARKNIHKENSDLDSQKLIDGVDLDVSNETQDSKKPIAEQPSQAKKFKKENLPSLEKSVKSPNNSRTDVKHTSSSMPVADQPKTLGSRYKFFLGPVLLAIGVLLFKNGTDHRDTKVCSFSELESKYHKEEANVWKHLQYGIEDILNNKSDKPAVFLFVHHGKQITEKLIKDIALTSSACFDASTNINIFDFTSKEAIKDYGHVIAEYKKSIKEGNVVLIANLNKIPGEAANALHSICDTVTPLVKKVIILLSLTVDQKYMKDKVIDTAENALRQLWQDKIKPNELEPIITRVSDQVLLLQSN